MEIFYARVHNLEDRRLATRENNNLQERPYSDFVFEARLHGLEYRSSATGKNNNLSEKT